MSPDLFSLYSELIMWNVKNKVKESFKVNGISVNNIRYADDTALTTNSQENLHEILQALKEQSEKRGLNINKKKTKIMAFSKKETPPTYKIILEEELEQVSSFDYLGSLVTSDKKCLRNIKKRIALAKQAFNNKKTILTNKKISIQIKKRFLKIYIWSTFLYGYELWTISKETQNHLEAAEIWFYQRLMCIPWRKRQMRKS